MRIAARPCRASSWSSWAQRWRSLLADLDLLLQALGLDASARSRPPSRRWRRTPAAAAGPPRRIRCRRLRGRARPEPRRRGRGRAAARPGPPRRRAARAAAPPRAASRARGAGRRAPASPPGRPRPRSGSSARWTSSPTSPAWAATTRRPPLRSRTSSALRLDQRPGPLDDQVEHARDVGLAADRAGDVDRGLGPAQRLLDLRLAFAQGGVEAGVLDRDPGPGRRASSPPPRRPRRTPRRPASRSCRGCRRPRREP